MVMWIVIGLAAWLALAVIVGLVVAPTLGAIGRSLSELPDCERWAFGTPSPGEAAAPSRPALRLVN
jgi:hypothetical protein